ncbi:hypothetical protein DPEC_G00099000 [Dallia pectoralis]|uniref:Uncharacterized protein n=1 Tax=Dallia pectoralis TaxID=75939 RepID=A0ACC2GWM0_DALPE|nr:hypothetical protein DPEC_G00099000 [Dallia pectoralis]
MDHYWFCVLLLLSTLIIFGHSQDLPSASVMIVSPQGPLYRGDTVTLQCKISVYTDWTYNWYRNNQPLPSQNSKTISISLPDQAGQYQCQGMRTGQPTSSYLSLSVPIIPTALPTASLTVSTQGRLYSGETVTLQCYISDYTDWTYYWYFNNQLQNPGSPSRTITTQSDQVSQYQCQGTRTDRPQVSQLSGSLHITVTVSLIEDSTDAELVEEILSTTLSTVNQSTFRLLGRGDTDWEYEFYKNRQSFYSDTKPEYRISPLYTSDTGSYTCRGVKGNKISTTSNAVQLTVSNRPKAVLSISPQWLNPGDSVTLICEVKEPSTGWRFSWYKTVPYRTGLPSLLDKSYSVEPLSGYETTEESDTLSPAGPTDTGGYVCRAGDSGVYWCESGSGQSSNAVNITVSGGDVILESPVHPVTEGNSVTLHCIYRDQPQTNTKVDFYKDGVLIRNGTTGEMTIPTVSKSDEGFYKCKSDERESPGSWMTVRCSPVSISLSRLLCGLLVVSPFLLVSIILIVKYYRAGAVNSIEAEYCEDVIEQTESSL